MSLPSIQELNGSKNFPCPASLGTSIAQLPAHRLGQCCAISSHLHPNGGPPVVTVDLLQVQVFAHKRLWCIFSGVFLVGFFLCVSEDCVLLLRFLHSVSARQAASVDAIQDVFHCGSITKKVWRTRRSYLESIWTDLYI